ncbi:MAG: N-acyl homoserine lactonase family protein [Proteobacteria bacterium]|nr:N-acyl homoserine lactonase family protein [Pseudomonadota bacterium]MBI3498683.1 N-acyl homoserine lactonase family protein [Pseudomonadota bacterium]
MAEADPYALYAIRYAHMAERRAAENFIGGDPHDGPMPMDYFIWAAVNASHRFVIDTGFNAETARRRQRQFLRCPAASLAHIGLDAGAIEDVVVTHMHYDHIGNFDLFPRARFHLQDREMAFATGRHMGHQTIRYAFDVETVVGLVRELYRDRVRFHDGTALLAPGFSLHWVGGHTAGLQVVRVWTRRGWVVLASDASHYYANMEATRPFPIVFHMGDMLEGYRTLRHLADSPRHIIPGHDPLVLARYPAPSPALDGIVARLDVEPGTD